MAFTWAQHACLELSVAIATRIALTMDSGEAKSWGLANTLALPGGYIQPATAEF